MKWHLDKVHYEWITGVSAGFEWVEDFFTETDVNFLVVDLLIFRLVFSFYKD